MNERTNGRTNGYYMNELKKKVKDIYQSFLYRVYAHEVFSSFIKILCKIWRENQANYDAKSVSRVINLGILSIHCFKLSYYNYALKF